MTILDNWRKDSKQVRAKTLYNSIPNPSHLLVIRRSHLDTTAILLWCVIEVVDTLDNTVSMIMIREDLVGDVVGQGGDRSAHRPDTRIDV